MRIRYLSVMLCSLAVFTLIGATTEAPLRIKEKDYTVPLSSVIIASCEPERTDVDLSGSLPLTCKVSRNGSLAGCTVAGTKAQQEWAICLSQKLRVKRQFARRTVLIPIRQSIND